MKRFAIVGFGSRGQNFAKLIDRDEHSQLFAVAEPVEHSRKKATDLYGVNKDFCFCNADEFFAQGKLCEAVFICTQDAQHYEHAMKALELGYNICLEKPAAVNMRQCTAIRDEAERLGLKVMLTHVLRYTPFFQKIKELITTGGIGKVATINLTENIAYWHYALSYVRGPWRRIEQSTPTIIAKCCHDLDLLVWLTDDKCMAVNSFAGVNYFTKENAPDGCGEYCVDCEERVKKECLYNAFKIYPERVKYAVIGGTSAIDSDHIMEVLSGRQHIWGKCVFHCSGNAVDNQVVNLLFKNGSTAHLTMTAFSDRCYRWIKVHGTKGEVYGDLDEGILHYTQYGQKEQIIDLNKNSEVALGDGHGGGDYYLFKDFCDYLDGKEASSSRTAICTSIESHLIGFKAEESRLNCGKTYNL